MNFRVLSYNIHKCIGGIDRRYDPKRIVDIIAHYSPDVVLLQEVDNDAKRSMKHRQVDLLGDLLAYPHRSWYPNVGIRGGGFYGNAILSRFEFSTTNNIELTERYKKVRSALHVQCDIPLANTHTSLHIFNAHLGLAEYERKRQVAKLIDMGSYHNGPMIVAGDLNDLYGSLGPKHFLPAGFRRMSYQHKTFPAFAPLRALDGLYVKGPVKIHRLQRGDIALARRASDHLPLIADLMIHS